MKQYANAFEILTSDPHALGIWTLRYEMTNAIVDEIRSRYWTQKEAAEFLGVTQPRISNLKRGKISKFSVSALIEMLNKLGFQFKIEFTRTQVGIKQ
jgi:predicted XRE-type DNA-binding protein